MRPGARPRPNGHGSGHRIRHNRPDPMPHSPPDDATAAAAPAPRPLTGGAAMGAAGRVTTAITGAATTILVARLLGDDGAGNFAIALTIVYVLTVLTTLGMEHGIAYYVSSGRWGPGHAFATSQRLAIAIGVAGAALGIGGRRAPPPPVGGPPAARAAR